MTRLLLAVLLLAACNTNDYSTPAEQREELAKRLDQEQRQQMAAQKAKSEAEAEQQQLATELAEIERKIDELTAKPAATEVERAAARAQLDEYRRRADAIKRAAQAGTGPTDQGKRTPVRLDPRCITDPTAPGC